MPAFYKITFLPEGRVQEFTGSRGNWYVLADGSQVRVLLRPVWCRCCDDVTEGEHIETLEEIDQLLADLRDSSSEAYHLSQGFRKSHLRDTELRRRWREVRNSPAKCILCGSTDIVPLDTEPIPHPAGSGTITLEWVAVCSTDSNNWFFSAEGNRIREDLAFRPTYWRLPGADPPGPEFSLEQAVWQAGLIIIGRTVRADSVGDKWSVDIVVERSLKGPPYEKPLPFEVTAKTPADAPYIGEQHVLLLGTPPHCYVIKAMDASEENVAAIRKVIERLSKAF